MPVRLALCVAWACSAVGLQDASALLQSSAAMRSSTLGGHEELWEFDAQEFDKYPVSGAVNWPFEIGPGAPDVYVHWCSSMKRSYEPWVYHPASFTIGQAFSELGASVKWTSHLDGFGHILSNITQSIRLGRTPIVVAIKFWTPAVNDDTRRFLADVTRAGGYLVLYQSENMAWVGQTHLPIVDRLAEEYGAKEIWDYSLASVEYYNKAGWNKLPIRYLPTGYVKELDFNVDLSSPIRNEKAIAYLGQFAAREQETQDGYRKQVGDMLQQVWVSTKEQLIDFVTRYPLHLNNHRAQDCCPSHNAVESFRFSQLVANKACIVSAICVPMEMKEWEGIVHFVDIPDTRKEVEELQKDLKKCQMDAYTTYKERFAPGRLFNRTAFRDVFLKLAPHLHQ